MRCIRWEVSTMKKYLSLLVVALLAFPAVFAQTEELPDAGTTPDSAFYFMDVAFDNIGLGLTFNKEKRIEKQLEIAAERLSETKAMAQEGRIEAMQRAQEE